MSYWQVWQAQDGREVKVRSQWLVGPPEVAGDSELYADVMSVVDEMGPYGESVVASDLEGDLQNGLRLRGFDLVACESHHEIPSDYLHAAVRQAESSASEELRFNELRKQFSRGGADEQPDLIGFIAAASARDRVLEHARSGVILAVSALEAYINEVAALHLRIWDDEDDRLAVPTKWILVTRHLSGGQTFDKGAEPFQSLSELVRFRNRVLHPKVDSQRFEGPLAGLKAVFHRPDWDVKLHDGRKACVTAREVLLNFSRLVGWDPPRWVSVVPPADPELPEDWTGATMLAGVREDPDFPKRGWPPVGADTGDSGLSVD